MFSLQTLVHTYLCPYVWVLIISLCDLLPQWQSLLFSSFLFFSHESSFWRHFCFSMEVIDVKIIYRRQFTGAFLLRHVASFAQTFLTFKCEHSSAAISHFLWELDGCFFPVMVRKIETIYKGIQNSLSKQRWHWPLASALANGNWWEYW